MLYDLCTSSRPSNPPSPLPPLSHHVAAHARRRGVKPGGAGGRWGELPVARVVKVGGLGFLGFEGGAPMADGIKEEVSSGGCLAVVVVCLAAEAWRH
jgi:hypothetical protein